MEPTHDSPASAGVAASGQAELVVQNGRLAGTCRALNGPVTLIGRAAGCDIRLNVDGVSSSHCVLVQEGAGVFLRDLHSKNGTFVNGERVALQPLKGGDILTVGPFQFLFRLPERKAAKPRPQDSEQEQRLQQRWLALDQQREQAEAKLRQEKEALRIQAAAVAAQQAALNDEEAKLQKRLVGLQQQEAQLAGHLDDKQRRLVEIQNQAREARNALQQERAAHEARVAQSARELEQGRKEIADSQKEIQKERQHLVELHKRMKRRWHRHWVDAGEGLRRREAELARQRQQLDADRERLEKQKVELQQDGLRFNGEVELGRRQLKAAWTRLRQDQRHWLAQRGREQAELQARGQELDEHQADLVTAEEELIRQRRQWDGDRLALDWEADGLRTRVRNFRQKLLDQEKEVARLQSVLHELRIQTGAAPSASTEPTPAATAFAVPGDAASIKPPDSARDPVMIDWQELITALEKAAGDLADQRLHLAEQCQRLLSAQTQWQHEHQAVQSEMETVAHRLAAREQHLQTGEHRLRHQAAQVAQARQQLETWQARMAAREAAWDGERERLLADLNQREQLVERRLEAITQLHQRWTQRRQREVERVQTDRSALVKFHQQCAAQRDEWLRRATDLQQKQKSLGERVLAMEHYKQEYLRRADDPKAAAERIEKLHQRWIGVFAAEEQAVARERQALEAEAGQLDESYRRLQQQATQVAGDEADLAQRQTTWERERLLVEDELERLRQQVHSLQAQRGYFEQERSRLRDEVERLAHLLIGDSERPPQSMAA